MSTKWWIIYLIVGVTTSSRRIPLNPFLKRLLLRIKHILLLIPCPRNSLRATPLPLESMAFRRFINLVLPLRPIVSTISRPTYHLAKFLAQNLKPLVGRTDSFVKYSASFIQEWKDFKLDPRDLLVSFDVVSLHTKIPIQEAVDIINCITDKDTTKLAGLYLTSTFFSSQGEFYEQTCGVAMGPPSLPHFHKLIYRRF